VTLESGEGDDEEEGIGEESSEMEIEEGDKRMLPAKDTAETEAEEKGETLGSPGLSSEERLESGEGDDECVSSECESEESLSEEDKQKKKKKKRKEEEKKRKKPTANRSSISAPHLSRRHILGNVFGEFSHPMRPHRIRSLYYAHQEDYELGVEIFEAQGIFLERDKEISKNVTDTMTEKRKQYDQTLTSEDQEEEQLGRGEISRDPRSSKRMMKDPLCECHRQKLQVRDPVVPGIKNTR
jgi:hypothetical protein